MKATGVSDIEKSVDLRDKEWKPTLKVSEEKEQESTT